MKGCVSMTNVNATNFRKDVFSYLDTAVTYNEVINVSTKKGNAILISEEDYNGLIATLELDKVPNLVQDIKSSFKESIQDMKDFDSLGW